MTKAEENVRGGILLALFATIGAGIIWLVGYGINWALIRASIAETNVMERIPGVVVFALAWAALLALEIKLVNKPVDRTPPPS